MIEVSLPEIFVLLLGVAFGLVGFAGGLRRLREWRERWHARRRTARCRYCGTLFERAPGHARVEHCPGCQAAIPAGRDRRLG